MTKKYFVTHDEVQERAAHLAKVLVSSYPKEHALKCYAIPRGGVPAAYAVAAECSHQIIMVSSPDEADFFMDDIIDSGATLNQFCDEWPGKPFMALFDKLGADKDAGWVVFPWENEKDDEGPEANIRRMLQYIGEDVERGGLLETPRRVTKALDFWFQGYDQDPADVLKVFEDGAEHCDEMVIVKDIPFYSKCEHHMADIFGTASIAYIPNGKIVGLSKLSRLLDVYARRLQVQERLTNQVADALAEHLDARGVGVVIKARHMCMESRGVCKQGHHTVTSALRGAIKEDPSTRSEFMALVK